MGFLDKAKKMAEQAQSRLQKRSRPRTDPGAPASSTATPPHGDPLAEQQPAPPKPAPTGPVPDPAAPRRGDEPPRGSGGDRLAG